MSLFDEHLAVAKTYATMTALAILAYSILSEVTPSAIVAAVALTWVFGFVSALIPDVDHHASKPRQIAGKLASVGILATVFGVLVLFPNQVQTIGQTANSLSGIGIEEQVFGLLVILGVAAVAISIGGTLFDELTTHRGITHSPVFVLSLFVLYYLALGFLAEEIGMFELTQGYLREIVAVAGVGGVLAHLWEDQ